MTTSLTQGSRRGLLSLFCINTSIGVGLTLLFLSIDPSEVRHLGPMLAKCQIYSHTIGGVVWAVMGVAHCRLTRLPGWQMWPLYLVLLAVLAYGGTAIAASVCCLLGLMQWSRWGQILVEAGRMSAIITWLVGITIFLFEKLRIQAEATSLELRTLQYERARAEKLAAEAQLAALESRLQPHFLFNTINSVLALIHEDPASAARMLERLTRLLRFALDSPQRPFIRLEEELKIVRDYLEIERVRFGDRLEFRIEAPKELADLEVPPYCLQTLVENGVKYAVSSRRAGGRVSVRAARYKGTLALEVRDDGPGFDRSSLLPGHGIDTLEKRLQALFGAEAFLEIEQDNGAAVRMRLPVRAAALV